MQYTLTFTVMVILHFKVSRQCDNNLCFTWKVTADKLTLKCRATQLIHKVFIYNQMGLLQADCFPPIQTVRCEQFAENGNITQNIRTNETIYIFMGKINSGLNGNWTCRHGTFKDVANVEVTILKLKEETTTEMSKVQDTYSVSRMECMQKTLLWSLVTFLIMVMIVMTALAFCYAYECLIAAVDILERCNPIRTCVQENAVHRVKMVSFCIFTLLYFGIIVASTFNIKNTCKFEYIFPAIGAIVAVILGCLCLGNREQRHQDPRHDLEELPIRMPLTEVDEESQV